MAAVPTPASRGPASGSAGDPGQRRDGRDRQWSTARPARRARAAPRSAHLAGRVVRRPLGTGSAAHRRGDLAQPPHPAAQRADRRRASAEVLLWRDPGLRARRRRGRMRRRPVRGADAARPGGERPAGGGRDLGARSTCGGGRRWRSSPSNPSRKPPPRGWRTSASGPPRTCVRPCCGMGDAPAALARLDAHLAAHPLREQACELRMRALYRLGRQAEALATYRRTRELFARELGIEPSTALRELEVLILRQDPCLDRPSPSALAEQFAVTGARPSSDGD